MQSDRARLLQWRQGRSHLQARRHSNTAGPIQGLRRYLNIALSIKYLGILSVTQECILAIKEHAFVASPYPVIITLENHTDAANQVLLVRILKEQLGASLFVPPPGAENKELLSPEALRGKFIIRTKVKIVRF